VLPYKLIFVLMHYFGAVIPLAVVWALGDVALAIVIIPNLLALILLAPKVVEETGATSTGSPGRRQAEKHKRRRRRAAGRPEGRRLVGGCGAGRSWRRPTLISGRAARTNASARRRRRRARHAVAHDRTSPRSRRGRRGGAGRVRGHPAAEEDGASGTERVTTSVTSARAWPVPSRARDDRGRRRARGPGVGRGLARLAPAGGVACFTCTSARMATRRRVPCAAGASRGPNP
jgi:hypothetical protein